MQYIEPHAFYFVGFGLAILIPYLIVRATSRGKDRFKECSFILILGIIVEQICALYWGNYFGNIVDFYVFTSMLFAPAVVLMLIDLIRQNYILSMTKPDPPRMTIDIE